MEDLAIKYNAKLVTLKDNIESLEMLEISTIDYSNILKEIEDEVKLKIKECYEAYSRENSNLFLQESIVGIYTNAIDRVDKINNYIVSEYESYYQIKLICRQLNEEVKGVNDTNVDQVVQRAVDLLDNLRTSTSINYENERKIVEDVYQVIYKIIKLELFYKNNSILLEKIKNSETDSVYISKLIKEDIIHVKQKNQTDDFVHKIQEVEINSFEPLSFLDKELIIFLNQYLDSDFVEQVRNRYFEQYDQYENKVNQCMDLDTQYIECLKNVDELRKKIKGLRLSSFKTKFCLLCNLGLLSSLYFFSMIFFRDITQATLYETTTTTYDTSDLSIDSVVDFEGSSSDSISLVEYSPWEEPGYFREKYKRNVYRYDLSNIGNIYSNLSDYLNSELKNTISILEEKVEVVSDKPDDQYTKNKYIITKRVQDKSVSKKVDRPVFGLVCAVLSSCVFTLIDFLVLKKFSKTNVKEIDGEIKNHKLQCKEKLTESLEVHTNFDQMMEELIQLRGQLECEYDRLPAMLQKDQDIQKAKVFVKSFENNINNK